MIEMNLLILLKIKHRVTLCTVSKTKEQQSVAFTYYC